MRGLADDAGAGESDHRPRLRQSDVSEGCKAGHHAGRRRVGQDRDVGKARLAVTGEGSAGLGHLHQGEHPLVHARPSGGADDDDGPAGLCGGLDDARDLFTHDGTHGCREKREIHHSKPDRLPAHRPRSGDHGIDQAGLFPVGLETLLISGHPLESEGVDGRHGGVDLLEGALVHQSRDALPGTHGEMMTALGADLHVLLEGEVMDHLRTAGALRPEPLGHLFSLFLGELEGRFSENGHGMMILHQTGRGWEARHRLPCCRKDETGNWKSEYEPGSSPTKGCGRMKARPSSGGRHKNPKSFTSARGRRFQGATVRS